MQTVLLRELSTQFLYVEGPLVIQNLFGVLKFLSLTCILDSLWEFAEISYTWSLSCFAEIFMEEIIAVTLIHLLAWSCFFYFFWRNYVLSSTWLSKWCCLVKLYSLVLRKTRYVLFPTVCSFHTFDPIWLVAIWNCNELKTCTYFAHRMIEFHASFILAQ